jgi:hypothetical protein
VCGADGLSIGESDGEARSGGGDAYTESAVACKMAGGSGVGDC